MIAIDLFAAILTADLPNRDMIVLSEVLLQSYGPQKRRDVHLDPVTIEHYTGLHRNNGRAAIKSLVAAKVLKQNDDGSHRFLKDYESWKPRGQPFADRLVGGLIRFAKSALSRFGIPIKRSKKVAIQPDITSTSTPIQSDWPDNCKANSTRLGQTTVGQSNEIDMELGDRHENRDVTPEPETPCVTPLACGGARASEELRVENREIGVLSERPNAAGASIQVMDRNGDVIDLDQGVQNDPREIARVSALVDEQLFPGMNFGAHVYSYRGTWPVAWMERVLIDARAWQSPPRSFSPIVNRLRQMTREGGPPEPLMAVPAPSANGHAAPPPSRAELRRKALSESARAWAAELAAETKEGDI